MLLQVAVVHAEPNPRPPSLASSRVNNHHPINGSVSMDDARSSGGFRRRVTPTTGGHGVIRVDGRDCQTQEPVDCCLPMLSLGMDWMPWIVVGTVAFCNRGEPTRRVIALVPGGEGPQFATGSPATARGRSHSASRSFGAGRPCLITAGVRSVPPGPRGRAGKWPCLLGGDGSGALTQGCGDPERHLRRGSRAGRGAWVNRTNTTNNVRQNQFCRSMCRIHPPVIENHCGQVLRDTRCEG
jgi:hypothetical protein